MDFNSVGNVLGMAYQYANRTQKTTASGTSFTESLQEAAETGAAGVEKYTEYLKSKYGNVMVQSVGRDQNGIDAIGAGTAGTGNIVIAPNILEEMANNSEKAAYYEEKIQYFLDSVPRYQAELSAMGHEIHSCGIVIHPDGTVTHYISGDLKPEVRAKIEAQIKAEQEEKAKRKKQYQELSAEAAEKRRLLMEQYNQKQMMAEKTADFRAKFAQKYPSCICKELLGYAISQPEQMKTVLDKGLLFDFCPCVVADTIEILEQIL